MTSPQVVDLCHQYVVKVSNMAGTVVELPSLSASACVADLAVKVREHCGVPICSMKLLKDGEVLLDLALSLMHVFGAEISAVDLMVIRRQLSDDEQAELDKQLIRNIARGDSNAVDEFLAEGANLDTGISNPCGGLSPLMMAIAAGDEDMSLKLREAGAPEPDMVPREAYIQTAFATCADTRLQALSIVPDFADVVRHIAAGADVNVRLKRGQGIAATSSGTPLHACCALRNAAGSTELALLLIRKKADLGAGDSEGDTPLAHAKYFRAQDLFEVLQNNGAELGGPYYAHRGFGRD